MMNLTNRLLIVSLISLLLILLFTGIRIPVCRAQLITLADVRNFALTEGTSFSFDLSLTIPVPVIGDVDIDLELGMPLTINLLNSTLVFMPIKVPYLIMPETKPIVFELSRRKATEPPPPRYFPPQPVYPQYDFDPYNYDPFDNEIDSTYFDSLTNNRRKIDIQKPKKKKKSNKSGKRKKSKKNAYNSTMDHQVVKPRRRRIDDAKRQNLTKQIRHYRSRNKRSLAASSAQHRLDFFTLISQTLDQYGFDGVACICRAVCELAEMELLIESPIHEFIEHLLRVSRANDMDGFLVDYIEAEKYGHKNGQVLGKTDACQQRYFQCPFSIFDRRHPI